MNADLYLRILTEEIHSVVDMMFWDKDGVYFLMGRGKDFYSQLTEQKFIALSGMTREENSIERKSVSLRGKVKSIGKDRLYAPLI